jgi:chitinase domain-containing protein 1
MLPIFALVLIVGAMHVWQALEFVKSLGTELHSLKGTHLYSTGPPQLVFVIPPPGNPKDPATFTSSDMTFLSDSVDGFSLMTYDYSAPQSPGPNAPLAWVKQCLHQLFPKSTQYAAAVTSSLRSKMLMGMNFYGNDYIIPQGKPWTGVYLCAKWIIGILLLLDNFPPSREV